MLKVPYFKQDTTYTCGPTALQMVFAFHNLHLSEKDLTKLVKTNKEVGTNHEPMIDLARKHSFFVYVNQESTLEEIERFINEGKPVIVNYVEKSEDIDHYAVVVGVNDNTITLHDPWHGEGIRIEIEDFLRRWYTVDVKTQKWLMVIDKDPIKIGKQFGSR